VKDGNKYDLNRSDEMVSNIVNTFCRLDEKYHGHTSSYNRK
jgi:hypothetical protein